MAIVANGTRLCRMYGYGVAVSLLKRPKKELLSGPNLPWWSLLLGEGRDKGAGVSVHRASVCGIGRFHKVVGPPHYHG